MISSSNPNRTLGITALAVFFLFGTLMSGLTAVMLAFPASPLQPLWKLNPRAHEGLHAMGLWAVLLMVVVCLACAAAACGLARCKRWGFWTAVVILSINIAGDSANAVLANDWRALIGIPIGGLMLLYLSSKRRVFSA
jgi:hypothetical protein